MVTPSVESLTGGFGLVHPQFISVQSPNWVYNITRED